MSIAFFLGSVMKQQPNVLINSTGLGDNMIHAEGAGSIAFHTALVALVGDSFTIPVYLCTILF